MSNKTEDNSNKVLSTTDKKNDNIKQKLSSDKKISNENIKIDKTNLEIELPKLLDEISNSKAKEKNNFELMLRTKAELENYKKRSKREKEDFQKYAIESIMKDLLIVIDNLERAIQASKSNEKNIQGIVEGLTLTLNEILKLLKQHNVTVIKSIGTLFDPKVHQAMSQETTSKYSPNIVIKEFLKGYLMHERLLRPAMVVISKLPGKK